MTSTSLLTLFSSLASTNAITTVSGERGLHHAARHSALIAGSSPPTQQGSETGRGLSSTAPYRQSSHVHWLIPRHGRLQAQDWFHGKMSAKDAAAILKNDNASGTFLVRESESKKGEYSLSVM